MSSDVTWGWGAFFEELQVFFLSASRQYGTATKRYASYVIERLDMANQNLLHILNCFSTFQPQNPEENGIIQHFSSFITELRTYCNELSLQWQQYLDNFDENMQSMIPYHVSVIFSGRRGRPSYNISREQILYLRSLSFRWNVIAKLLGISVMTLYRRRQEFGLVEDPRNVTESFDNHGSYLKRSHYPCELKNFNPSLGLQAFFVTTFRDYKLAVSIRQDYNSFL